MAVGSWDTPFYLVTDQGSLTLNEPASTDGGFLLDVDACAAGVAMRASKDNVPQADGSILHHRFVTGYEMHMELELWTPAPNNVLACYTTDPSADYLNDTLMRHLRAMVDGNGRVLWQPAYGDTRLMDQVKLLQAPVITVSPGGPSRVAFTLDSPFPYIMDYTQIVTALSGGVSDTLSNIGTAPFYPVFKVYGPVSQFTLTNITTGKSFSYDADQPGAQMIGTGEYAEISTFGNTIYLNGDQDNLKPGIVIATSDFFPLAVGDNEIIAYGDGTLGPYPDVDVLWQAAWF